MHRSFLVCRAALVLVTAGIAATVALPSYPSTALRAAEVSVEQRVSDLLGPLSHDSEFVRANAERELFAMGPSAREELMRHTRDPDPRRAAAAQRLAASARWGWDAPERRPEPAHRRESSPQWRVIEPPVAFVPAPSGPSLPGDAPARRLEDSRGLGTGAWRGEFRDDAWAGPDAAWARARGDVREEVRFETRSDVRADEEREVRWYAERDAERREAAGRDGSRRDFERNALEDEIRRLRDDTERRIGELQRRIRELDGPPGGGARSGQVVRDDSLFAWTIEQDGGIRIQTRDANGAARVYEAANRDDLRRTYPEIARRLDAVDGEPQRETYDIRGPFDRRPEADRLPPQRLGITFEAVPPMLREHLDLEPRSGVLVRTVEDGSLASRLGLREGDVLLALNGRAIAGPDAAVGDVLGALAVSGDDVTAEVVRRGRRETLRSQ